MSLLITVLIVFVVLVIIYYIIDWATSKSNKLSHIRHATTKTISPSKLKGSNSSNFTFSVWFYVDDWSVNYGVKKKLLQVESGGNKNLEIDLGKDSNDINITLACFASHNNGQQGQQTTQHSVQTTSTTCPVQNFPLQKWVNLIVSVYGRTLDVYIDGKLVKTCVLPGAAAMHNISKIILTEGNPSCFKGMTADLTYWANPSNPQQAYNIYASGFGGMGSNFFSKYKLKVSFLEDGKTEGSFEI